MGGDARSHSFKQSVQVAHVVGVFRRHVRRLLQTSRVEAVAALAAVMITATGPHGLLLLARELISERVECLVQLLRLHDPVIHLAEHVWQDLLRGLVDWVGGRGKQHRARALGEDGLLRW